jgi:hypothetical protein
MSRDRGIGTRRQAVLAAAAALALAWTLAGCNDSTTRPCDPPKTGSPPNCRCPEGTVEPDCRPGCTTTSVVQDSGGIPARTVVFEDFSVPDTGRLDVTLDWTLPASPIGFYLVPANTCTSIEEFNARTCNFLVRSEPSSTKPRKISTPNFAAGNYRWLVANYAQEQESVSLQIVLQKGSGCAPLTGGAPGTASRDDGSLPPLSHLRRR